MALYPYPSAPRGDLEDDPYRPLEDPSDPETIRFVEEQNELTERVLSTVGDRQAIRERLTELWDYAKNGIPFERGGNWFQMRNSGLQAQSVLWVSEGPTDDGRVLVDPNSFSEAGTIALSGLGVTRDSTLLAYATSDAGSDFLTWRIRRVDTGEDLPDVVEWSKFSSAAWNKDGSGFYYGAVARPAPGQELREAMSSPRIMFHRVGSSQASDQLVFETSEHPDWIPEAVVSHDGTFLIVSIQRGTGTETQVLVQDLDNGGEFTPLTPDFSCKATVVGNRGRTFYLLTDKDAERGRVVSTALDSVGAGWETVIGERDATLVECHLYGGRLVCHYLEDAQSKLSVFNLDGTASHEVPLPRPVSLVGDPLLGVSVDGDPDSPFVRYQMVSFSQSGAVWSHDLDSQSSQLVSTSAAPVDPDRIETSQVFVESADGTLVPLFVTRRVDVVADGDAPVLLYGYGGFDIPITPSFSPTFAAWVDRGGVLAVASLRGGGEYGRPWHDAGRLANKQNVFDDFAACARWLGGASGWSRPGRIGIWGGSNGGLLVGASITQNPSLFGGAVADVGVFDMLRFHLWTIGWAWKSDYGDPEDPEAQSWLRAYSPLHNVHAGECYPPTMLLTGDHDDRVVPAHSFKFAAALQQAQGCDNPILLRVETSVGHGFGKPTAKLIAEAADRLAFLDLALSG